MSEEEKPKAKALRRPIGGYLKTADAAGRDEPHEMRLREIVMRRKGEAWDLVTDRGVQNGETWGGFQDITECIDFLTTRYNESGVMRQRMITPDAAPFMIWLVKPKAEATFHSVCTTEEEASKESELYMQYGAEMAGPYLLRGRKSDAVALAYAMDRIAKLESELAHCRSLLGVEHFKRQREELPFDHRAVGAGGGDDEGYEDPRVRARGEAFATIRFLEAIPVRIIEDWGLNAVAELIDLAKAGELSKGAQFWTAVSADVDE
jgi:hypothetical protein